MESLPARVDNSVNEMITVALEKNIPIETLERLLAMKERIDADNAKREFFEALRQFQLTCPEIPKTKPVKTADGKIAYYYAPLDKIIATAKKPLAELGFSYTINSEVTEDYIIAIVLAHHIGGHTEPTKVTSRRIGMTKLMNESQQDVGTLTLVTRRAFCNAFGIVAGDEDIDGRTVNLTIQEEELVVLKELLTKLEISEELVMNSCKVDTIEKITQKQALAMISNLKKKLIEREKNG